MSFRRLAREFRGTFATVITGSFIFSQNLIVRKEIKGDIKDVREEIKGGIKGVRKDLKDVETNLKTEIHSTNRLGDKKRFESLEVKTEELEVKAEKIEKQMIGLDMKKGLEY